MASSVGALSTAGAAVGLDESMAEAAEISVGVIVATGSGAKLAITTCGFFAWLAWFATL